MNKLMRLGSLFFTFVLLGFAALKYSSGSNKTAIYFAVAGIGFLIVFIQYWKKDKASK